MSDKTLTDRDRAILSIERQWWQFPGAKEKVIREQLGCTTTRYYQELNALIDTEAALAYDPILVKRLHGRRLRRTG